MSVITDAYSALKEYVTLVGEKVVEDGQATWDTVKSFLQDDYDETTETVYFPAYARGIGSVYITAGTGQTLADGTIYFPSQSSTGETVIFSAGGSSGTVEYRNVITTEGTTRDFSFSKSGTSYYYRPNLNVSGDRIRIFWQDTYSGKEINGVYVLTGSYPQAFPANVNGSTPNYACRLKYWTFSSYKGTTVDNSNGLDVPDEYSQTWNINIGVGGDTISYGDYVSQVIQSANTYIVSNLEEPTLDPSSPPSEFDWDTVVEEVYPDATDPTEPGGGFTFDYNEVVSPSELRQILGQETYDIETVDDRGILTVEVPTLPAATFSAEGLEIFVDSVDAGHSLLSSWGLWIPFVATAVVVVLFRFLR